MVQCQFCVCFHCIKLNKTQTNCNTTTYGEKFYYLTYQDKIENLKGHIFKRFLPLNNLGMDFHVRTEMRQSLVIYRVNFEIWRIRCF